MTTSEGPRKPPPGVRARHSRRCRANEGGVCNCPDGPSYEAWAFDRKSGKKIRETFAGRGALSAAKAWRSEAATGLRRGTLRASTPTTVRQAWEKWLAGASDGAIRNRSGDAFKPSVLRSYATSMRLHVLPELGGARLSDVSRVELQDLADRLLAEGRDPSTIRNALVPLRVLFRRAIARGELAVNPTSGLELPAVRGRRDRIASPTEAATLLAALPEADRPLWATAFYAGLRLGELQGLRDEDVALDEGVVRVRRSWDRIAGEIAPKSRAGLRDVPIVAELRRHLAAHRLRRGSASGLFFGEQGRAFDRDVVVRRAEQAWKAAGLQGVGLHEARHSCASLFIASGLNLKAIASFMGHSSITITLDRYGHLLPGSEDEAVALVDGYLARTGASAGAQQA
jgi:integrase